VLKDWCKENKNPKTDEPYNLYRDGLKIYTTIDSRMQKYAEKAVEEHMPILQQKLNAYFKIKGDKLWKGHDDVILAAMKFTDRWKSMEEEGIDSSEIRKSFLVPVKMKIFSWWGNKNHEIDTVMTPFDSIKYHKQLLQTSFAAMDPRTGEIKAWVGGIDYKWFKFDHVTANRQVGSTFKPLFSNPLKAAATLSLSALRVPSCRLSISSSSFTRCSLSAKSFSFDFNSASKAINSSFLRCISIDFASNCFCKAVDSFAFKDLYKSNDFSNASFSAVSTFKP
jgi:hypothetical protein